MLFVNHIRLRITVYKFELKSHPWTKGNRSGAPLSSGALSPRNRLYLPPLPLHRITHSDTSPHSHKYSPPPGCLALLNHIYSINTNATTQVPRARTPSNNRNSQDLPLGRALHPGRRRHGPRQHDIVAPVGADRQAAGAALVGRGRHAARPVVDRDHGPPVDVRLGDADADRVRRRRRELEVYDVVVVDVLPQVPREAAGRARAHDVVARVPLQTLGVSDYFLEGQLRVSLGSRVTRGVLLRAVHSDFWQTQTPEKN